MTGFIICVFNTALQNAGQMESTSTLVIKCREKKSESEHCILFLGRLSLTLPCVSANNHEESLAIC
jgi:hypothetical protein